MSFSHKYWLQSHGRERSREGINEISESSRCLKEENPSPLGVAKTSSSMTPTVMGNFPFWESEEVSHIYSHVTFSFSFRRILYLSPNFSCDRSLHDNSFWKKKTLVITQTSGVCLCACRGVIVEKVTLAVPSLNTQLTVWHSSLKQVTLDFLLLLLFWSWKI